MNENILSNKQYKGFVYDKLQFKHMNYTINSIKKNIMFIFIWFYTKIYNKYL